MAAASRSEATECQLLNLPQEIQDKIWSEALPNNQKVYLSNKDKPPGLLGTCRQLRAELSGLYYNTNTFFISPEGCAQWLKSCELNDRMFVRHIRLCTGQKVKAETLKSGQRALRRFQALKDMRAALSATELHHDLQIEVALVVRGELHWVSGSDEHRVARPSSPLSQTSSMAVESGHFYASELNFPSLTSNAGVERGAGGGEQAGGSGAVRRQGWVDQWLYGKAEPKLKPWFWPG